jgi:hypothetical protein
VSAHRTLERDESIDLPAIEVVDRLTPLALIDLVTQTAALHARAMARLTVISTAVPMAPAGDEMLTARGAAPLLGVSEDWVRRHGAREGLAIRVGRRTVRYSRSAIARYHKRRTIA